MRDAHLEVPPSLGDQTIPGERQAPQDDMAPEMARIRYCVRARLIKSRGGAHELADVAERIIRVRVVPVREVDPPLAVGQDSRDFQLRKEKSVRKGIFKGKLGRITAEAQQPSGFRLLPPGKSPRPSISTMVTLNLRFDPVDEHVRPPILDMLVSKIRVRTFFCSEPFQDFPSRSALNQWDVERGFYVQGLELSSRCVSSVEWHPHDPDQATSTDSPRPLSSSSDVSVDGLVRIPDPSQDYKPQLPFFTAKVLVPMTLPEKKYFPPTFHSCLVSRNYALDLHISYHAPGTSVPTPSLHLFLPIQVSAEGNPSTSARISPEEAEAMAANSLDEEIAESQLVRRNMTSPVSPPRSNNGQMAANMAGLRNHTGENRNSLPPDPPAYSFSNGTEGAHLRRASLMAQGDLSRIVPTSGDSSDFIKR